MDLQSEKKRSARPYVIDVVEHSKQWTVVIYVKARRSRSIDLQRSWLLTFLTLRDHENSIRHGTVVDFWPHSSNFGRFLNVYGSLQIHKLSMGWCLAMMNEAEVHVQSSLSSSFSINFLLVSRSIKSFIYCRKFRSRLFHTKKLELDENISAIIMYDEIVPKSDTRIF